MQSVHMRGVHKINTSRASFGFGAADVKSVVHVFLVLCADFGRWCMFLLARRAFLQSWDGGSSDSSSGTLHMMRSVHFLES
jgi:hypothetical protein